MRWEVPVLSATLYVTDYREAKLLPWQQEVMIIRDGPVWFITMVIGPACLVLQPDFIASTWNTASGKIILLVPVVCVRVHDCVHKTVGNTTSAVFKGPKYWPKTCPARVRMFHDHDASRLVQWWLLHSKIMKALWLSDSQVGTDVCAWNKVEWCND